ncbi:DNA repair protein RecO [Reinekea sp.]|jgi:DNA repair protein RecO (recombination protein O)|uniref:DNA repair protein RecO n=1 Tax=Reinekea sp. TaxID=1970455 RepID=UPI003989C587
MVARATIVRGFLLHAQAIEERHFLCDVFTHENGLLRCKFNGNRPEFFRQFEIKLTSKNNFYSCHDFRYLEPLCIHDSPARLYGLYINELAFRLLPRQIETGPFYGTYVSSLVQIQAGKNLLPSLRFYEKQLLTLLGSGIDYQRSVDGFSIDPESHYHYQAGLGFVQSALGACLGKPILANAENNYEVKGALAIARHCQYQQLLILLENRPINSREWLKFLAPNREVVK